MRLIYITTLFFLFATFNYSQTEWFKYPGNPVLSPGPESWDIGEVASTSIIFDNGEYKMWYMGGTSANFNDQIGYATSPDGINWTKYSGNPVLTPGSTGSFDAGAVGTPTVIRDGDTLKMWYVGSMTNTVSQLRIGYAVSTDGINWVKQNNGGPVLDLGSAGEWDSYFVTHPIVIRDGALLKMWYHGRNSAQTLGSIGYATSTDGINWAKYDNPSTQNAPYAESDPVLVGTTGRWDAIFTYQPCVILNSDTLEMWYTGYNGTISKIGYANSTDGIDWNKHPDPVLPDSEILAPSVIYNGSFYKMWYTEWYTGSNRRISYAATDSSAVPVELETFTAVAIGNNINLIWVTATELNNYGFELFRNGSKIAFINGRGTTTEKQEYFYEDKNLKDGIYNYRLEQLDYDGTRSIISSEITVHLTIPEIFSLEQNYPNPFNPSTTISWQSPVGRHQTLKVYDLLGNEVATLVDEYKPAGRYEINFDGSNLTTGVYLYRLRSGEFVETKKFILLK